MAQNNIMYIKYNQYIFYLICINVLYINVRWVFFKYIAVGGFKRKIKYITRKVLQNIFQYIIEIGCALVAAVALTWWVRRDVDKITIYMTSYTTHFSYQNVYYKNWWFTWPCLEFTTIFQSVMSVIWRISMFLDALNCIVENSNNSVQYLVGNVT